MNQLLAGCLACYCFFNSAFSEEQSFAELINQTKATYDQGSFEEAYQSLHKASLHVFEKMPLKLFQFVLVEKPADGYGLYTKKESNVYKADEPIYIYCEPKGYTFKRNAGEYHFALTTDFSVSNQEGHVLGGQNDFGSFEFISHQPSMEFLLNLTYSLSGLEDGEYKIHTTVKDQNSGKQTTETIEIRINQ